jgi:hypothetical protein
MNWAWHQDLPPTPKLILMALADAADDHGICWPSVPTVAAKCRVSDRTVRRVMRTLAAHGLMISAPRHRQDGSCSSNRYRLLLEGGDKLTGPPYTGVSTPGQGCQGPPDTGVTLRTTRGTQNKSPQPPAAEPLSAVSPSAGSGGGELFELEYPKDVLPAERIEAEKLITALKAPLDQQVLDEWAGILSAGAIRSSPLACLRALIKRAQDGRFTPERALRVAQARKTRQRLDATEARIMSDAPAPVPIDEGNPLARRIADIAKRTSLKR